MKHRPFTSHSSLKALAGLLMLTASGSAFSDCTPLTVNHPEQVISIRNTTSLLPLNAGTEITFANISFTGVFTGCENAPYTDIAQSYIRAVKTPDNSGITYPTGVQGIGYKLTTGYIGSGHATQMSEGPTGQGKQILGYRSQLGVNLEHRMSLVATSYLSPGTYSIPRQTIALTRSRDYLASSINGSPGASSNVVLGAVTLVVKNQTCDLAAGDTNRTIKLDPVQRSEFVGQSAGKKQFEISANCTDKGNVTFRFSGTPATGDAWRFANTGTAKGITVWLYSRIAGTEQTITANSDNNSRTIAVSNGKAALPLGVAYFNQTAGTVNAGTVASTATVNITYD